MHISRIPIKDISPALRWFQLPAASVRWLVWCRAPNCEVSLAWCYRLFLKKSNLAAISPFLLKFYLLRTKAPPLNDSNLDSGGRGSGTKDGMLVLGLTLDDGWLWDANKWLVVAQTLKAELGLFGIWPPLQGVWRVRTWWIWTHNTLWANQPLFQLR